MDYNGVYEKIREIISTYLNIEKSEIKPESNLVDEFCIDSIALVELGFRFSESFNVPMLDGSTGLVIMKDLVSFIHKNMSE